MLTPFRAIVELGCQCGEQMELPIEEVRMPFNCDACDHEHVLGALQLDAIEEAFGRALILAHGKKGADKVSTVSKLRH